MKKIKYLLFSIVLTTIMAVNMPNGGYQPGDTAQEFKLKNVDGNMLSLAEYANSKGCIVVFTCNHCPFSKLYEDRIIALDKKYKSLGFPVIAINSNDPVQYPDDSYDNMIKRSEEKGFTFPYLFDESQEIAKNYGAERTPHVFVLERAGVAFVVKYIGAIDNNSKEEASADQKYVENAVDELLNGSEVTVKTTKAVGCGIKWKE